MATAGVLAVDHRITHITTSYLVQVSHISGVGPRGICFSFIIFLISLMIACKIGLADIDIKQTGDTN